MEHLRKIYCACDGGSLCSAYNPRMLTAECRECCEGFCKMWDKLKRLVAVPEYLQHLKVILKRLAEMGVIKEDQIESIVETF